MLNKRVRKDDEKITMYPYLHLIINMIYAFNTFFHGSYFKGIL